MCHSFAEIQKVVLIIKVAAVLGLPTPYQSKISCPAGIQGEVGLKLTLPAVAGLNRIDYFTTIETTRQRKSALSHDGVIETITSNCAE
jgi:hypothetical protein